MNLVGILVGLLLVAQAAPTVTVSLDGGFYGPGEEVVIHILATDPHNDTAFLWLYIDGPDGRNQHFTNLPFRSQNLSWTIPSDATLGAYTVTVTWDHQYAQTGFIVQRQPIPEFPFMPAVVFLVAFAIATLALSRRQASARSEAVASHPRAHELR